MPKFQANMNYITPSPPSSMKQCNKSAKCCKISYGTTFDERQLCSENHEVTVHRMSILPSKEKKLTGSVLVCIIGMIFW